MKLLKYSLLLIELILLVLMMIIDMPRYLYYIFDSYICIVSIFSSVYFLEKNPFSWLLTFPMFIVFIPIMPFNQTLWYTFDFFGAIFIFLVIFMELFWDFKKVFNEDLLELIIKCSGKLLLIFTILFNVAGIAFMVYLFC